MNLNLTKNYLIRISVIENILLDFRITKTDKLVRFDSKNLSGRSSKPTLIRCQVELKRDNDSIFAQNGNKG